MCENFCEPQIFLQIQISIFFRKINDKSASCCFTKSMPIPQYRVKLSKSEKNASLSNFKDVQI